MPPKRYSVLFLPADERDEIKGAQQPEHQLKEMAGYDDRPEDFRRLLKILDSDLRLITPVEANRTTDSDSEKRYQLTHDYLVPGIREWLTYRQNETWQGRAELRLQEYSTLWNRKRKRRFLPNLVEYLAIVFGVPKIKRKESQNAMLSAATRYHGAIVATVALIAAVSAWAIWQVNGRSQAKSLMDKLATANPRTLTDNDGEVLAKFVKYRKWTEPRLIESNQQLQIDEDELRDKKLAFEQNGVTEDEIPEYIATFRSYDDAYWNRGKVQCVLAQWDDSKETIQTLLDRLLRTWAKDSKAKDHLQVEKLRLYRDCLKPYQKHVVDQLWVEFDERKTIAVTNTEEINRAFLAGMALIAFDNENLRWTDSDLDFILNHIKDSNEEARNRSKLFGLLAPAAKNKEDLLFDKLTELLSKEEWLEFRAEIDELLHQDKKGKGKGDGSGGGKGDASGGGKIDGTGGRGKGDGGGGRGKGDGGGGRRQGRHQTNGSNAHGESRGDVTQKKDNQVVANLHRRETPRRLGCNCLTQVLGITER